MSAKIQVLVVDDEATILRFLKPALEANGYERTSAGTVVEATKRIAAESPDIVLLDLGLPDGDGKDVIRRAREWSDVPIIVLSARTTTSTSHSMSASCWRACAPRCVTACSARPRFRC